MTLTQCKWLAQWPLYLALLGLPACNVGCVHLYPKWLDDPEVKGAAIEFFRDSAKNYTVNGEVHNPELEIAFKQGVSMRLVGVKSGFGFSAVSPPPVQP